MKRCKYQDYCPEWSAVSTCYSAVLESGGHIWSCPAPRQIDASNLFPSHTIIVNKISDALIRLWLLGGWSRCLEPNYLYKESCYELS